MRYLFASASLLLIYAIFGCFTYHGAQITTAVARPVDPVRPAASVPPIQTVALPLEDLSSPIASSSGNSAAENPPVAIPAVPWHPTKKIGISADALPAQRDGEGGKSSTENTFRHPLTTF